MLNHSVSSAIYSTKEAAACVGFSVRQLDYWEREGLVIPSKQRAEGRGTCRRYTLDDVVRLQFIARLKQSGLSIQKIRKSIGYLDSVVKDPNPLKIAWIVHEQDLLIILFKTEQGRRVLIDALNSQGQQVLEIVLETLMRETQLEMGQCK